jgi:DNA processing protein
MLQPKELDFWLSFSCFLKIGPIKFKRLLTFFNTAEAAFLANALLLQKAGLEQQLISEFIAFRETFQLEKVKQELAKEHISLCTLKDDLYPPLLKQISNPPFLFYVKGDTSSLQNGFPLALVGTRRASSYGKQAAHTLSKELARHGLIVLSGGALGIDTFSHRGALEGEGKTIAVLAGGLDEASWFPKENTQLFQEIIKKGGAVISEYPPLTPSLHFNFPNRNRIVSGISLGTLVIEAPEGSGALITAQYAAEQNREVFAIPGSIYSPLSYGNHYLIRQGAGLVTSAKEILEALNLNSAPLFEKARATLPATPREQKILSFLSHEPCHVDLIVRASGLTSPEVTATLTTLEMKGIIQNMGNMNYVVTD